MEKDKVKDGTAYTVGNFRGAKNWDYRIIKSKPILYSHFVQEEPHFSIHEVYYNELEEVVSYTAHSVSPYGDTYDELERDLELFLSAKDKPILDEEELLKSFKEKFNTN